MKTSFLALVSLATTLGTGFAGDVAVLDIKTADNNQLQRVVIEFYEDAAPQTVANFKKLAGAKFYDHVKFHRVFPHQMVQTGDPLSKHHDRSSVGTGAPGYTLPPEINSHKHLAGTVAAARLPDKINPGRVSNGSQFYVTLAPMPNLDRQYTVFGHVTQGLGVLDAISVKPADTNDNPVDPVVIESIRIVPREAAAAPAAVRMQPRRGMMQRIWHWF